MGRSRDIEPPIEQHYSATSIAKKLDVSPDLVRDLMDRFELPYVMVGSRKRVRESDLKAFAESRRVERPARHLKAAR